MEENTSNNSGTILSNNNFSTRAYLDSMAAAETAAEESAEAVESSVDEAETEVSEEAPESPSDGLTQADPTEVSEAPEEQAEGSSEGEEAESEEPPAKTITVGEAEIDLAQELTITTKAGKEATVSMQDLINDHWGKSEVHRRLTDLDKMVKDEIEPYKQDVQYVRDMYTALNEDLSGENKQEAVSNLLERLSASIPGLNEGLQEFYGVMFNEFQRVQGMTEQQRAQYAQDRELDRLRQFQNETLNGQHSAQTQEELQGRTSGLAEKYGLESQQVVEVIRQLKQRGDFKEETPLDAVFEVTEAVIQDELVTNTIKGLMETAEQGLSNDDNAVKDIKTWVYNNPDLTEEQVLDRVRRLYSSQEKLKNVAAKSKKKKPAKKKPVQHPNNGSPFFEDYMKEKGMDGPIWDPKF